MNFPKPTARPKAAGIVRIATALFAAAHLPGCVAMWNMGPGAASPTFLHTNTAYPNAFGKDTVHSIPYDSGLIEIVGWVDTERASMTFGGRIPGVGGGDVFGHRDSDYGQSLRTLKERYHLDGLLNKTVDTRRWAFDIYLIRFHRIHTHLGGVGYRFRDRKPLPLDAEPEDDSPPPMANLGPSHGEIIARH